MFQDNLVYDLQIFVCFSIVAKVLRGLETNKNVAQFIRVFARASFEVGFFMLMFSIAFVGFAFLGNLIYGSSLQSFSTIGYSVETLLRTMAGEIEYEQMSSVDPTWTPIFFFVYILFVILILVNVFIAILNTSFTSVRNEMSYEKMRFERLQAIHRGGGRSSHWGESFRYLLNPVAWYDPVTVFQTQEMIAARLGKKSRRQGGTAREKL